MRAFSFACGMLLLLNSWNEPARAGVPPCPSPDKISGRGHSPFSRAGDFNGDGQLNHRANAKAERTRPATEASGSRRYVSSRMLDNFLTLKRTSFDKALA
jgi:hypothetical protein